MPETTVLPTSALDMLDALLKTNSVETLGAAMHLRKRQMIQAEAKASQPKMASPISPEDVAIIVGLARTPQPSLKDSPPAGFDLLCQSVQDCIDAGDAWDLIHMLLRVWREAWRVQPHLGPIEGIAAKLAADLAAAANPR